MQGTGVQTDPYLIETWDDFFDMTNDSQSTYYMLVSDLDGNDYNGGVFGDSKVVHSNLDGNGHTIRNLYFIGYSGGYLMRPNVHGGLWKNLTIANVQTTCAVFGNDQTKRDLRMEHCTISAECYALASVLSLNMTECTLSLKAIAAVQSASYNQNFRSSMLRCSANVRLLEPTERWGELIISSTRLEMQLDKPPTAINSSPLSVSNSVLAIRMPEGVSDAHVIQGDSTSPSVLDSTLWGDTPTDGITDMILLPTEDMKNADALNAAGFSVVRVS